MAAGSPRRRRRIVFRGYARIAHSGQAHAVALMTISISDHTGDNRNRSHTRRSIGDELAELRDGVREARLEQVLRELRRLSNARSGGGRGHAGRTRPGTR